MQSAGFKKLLSYARNTADLANQKDAVAKLEILKLSMPIRMRQAAEEQLTDGPTTRQDEANRKRMENALHGPPPPPQGTGTKPQGNLLDMLQSDPQYAQYGTIKEIAALVDEFIDRHQIDRSKFVDFSPSEHNHHITHFFTLGALDKLSSNELVQTSHKTRRGAIAGISALTQTSAGPPPQMSTTQVIQFCTQGFVRVTPPEFCWKPSYHNTEIPTKCKAGYHHWGAECFQNCKAGYHWVSGGTCWEDCTKPYRSEGLVCYKNFHTWHTKKSYWAKRKTHFSSTSECNYEDQYKSGALCYKKCATYSQLPNSMTNCGGHACSQSPGACSKVIFDMIKSIGKAIVNIAAMVVTAGAAGVAISTAKTVYSVVSVVAVPAAKALANKIMQKVKGDKLTEIGRNLKDSIMRVDKEEFKRQSARWAQKLIKEAEGGIAAAQAAKFDSAYVNNLCQDLAGAYYDQIGKDADAAMKETLKKTRGWTIPNISERSIPLAGMTVNEAAQTAVDAIPGVHAFDDCNPSHMKFTGDSRVGCAKAALEVAAFIDPTGLAGVASAFMHRTCEPQDTEDVTWSVPR